LTDFAAGERPLTNEVDQNGNFFVFAKQNAVCLRRQEKRCTDFAAGERPLTNEADQSGNFFVFAKQNAVCLRRQEKRCTDFAAGERPLTNESPTGAFSRCFGIKDASRSTLAVPKIGGRGGYRCRF